MQLQDSWKIFCGTVAYDVASRVTASNRTTNGSGTNVASSLAYDSTDRVTTLTHQVSGGASLDSFVYGYDSGGRLRTETNTEGLATYGYDAANQLTSVTRPAGQTNESYSYDSGGNRTMTSYTTGVGNELLASPGATYAYDAEGNMAAKTETSTGNVWSYTYDIRNRMTGVTEKNSGGTVIYQASYTYDALDRRIATTVNGTTTWTVYDGQNTYADFSGAGVLKTRYLYGPAVDALLARTDSSGTTSWYLTDRLGSVRDLASTSGAALDHLAYDAYGNIVSESQPSNGDRFKWTAREWDGTTGLQFNRHRYYAPSVGRWTQLDPIGVRGGDSCMFRYVFNQSTGMLDPQGHDIWIENNNSDEPTGHQSVAVGDPLGTYRQFSYGATGTMSFPNIVDATVYEDVGSGGTIEKDSYYKTSPELDALYIKSFELLVEREENNKYPYPCETCRSWSQRTFDTIARDLERCNVGVKSTPPQREPAQPSTNKTIWETILGTIMSISTEITRPTEQVRRDPPYTKREMSDVELRYRFYFPG